MKSTYTLLCLASLVAATDLCELGCGSSGATNSANSHQPADPDGGIGGDGSTSVDPSVAGPFTFRDRLIGWSGGYTGGFYRPHGYAIAGKRLFSLPDALSPTLGAVTLVDVSSAKPRAFALPVAGKFPAGTVEAFTYDPSQDRIVLIVRPRQGTRTEIVTIALGDKEATFTTLTQVGAVTPKSLVGPLYPAGGGVIVASLGNTTASFTISGTTATWSAEVAGTIFAGNGSSPMEDPVHARALAFGNHVFNPGTGKLNVEPAIMSLALAPPYTWTPMPFGGDAPPNADDSGAGGTAFTVYDQTGQRVLAAPWHDTTCGSMPCKVPGLWSFDLNTHQWTKLSDVWTTPRAYTGGVPFLVQQDARRILEPSDGALVSTSLDPSNPSLAGVPLALDGDLGPASPSGAAVLGDGRIVSTDGIAFRVLDPKETAPRWSRFGSASMPSALAPSASISADPKTGEILVFGTPNYGQPDALATELQVLSADGKAIAKVAAAGGPPPRSGHGAIVVDGTLFVAGGSSGETALDDVWAFDRNSAQWAKIATLPEATSQVTLSLGNAGELLVAGRSLASGAAKNSPLFAVDRTTHAVRTLDAAGAPLWSTAPYRGCFIGYESGDTIDSSGPTMWRCTLEGGAIQWTQTRLDEHDFALYGLRGAASPDGLHAYFVGRHLWEAIGK